MRNKKFKMAKNGTAHFCFQHSCTLQTRCACLNTFLIRLKNGSNQTCVCTPSSGNGSAAFPCDFIESLNFSPLMGFSILFHSGITISYWVSENVLLEKNSEAQSLI